MPKKHQSRALLTKPASSAPSTLTSSKAPSFQSHGEPSKPTVNELIREARRLQGDTTSGIGASALPSVHPAVRAVLNMPAPTSPAPRRHLRGPARVRRIPGPPPPQSWLAESQHAKEDIGSAFQQLRWLRARTQQRSSNLPGSDNFASATSLEHLALSSIAKNWAWHAEFYQTDMSALPTQVRLKLLSYLAVYSEAGPNPLPLLFPPECEQNELDAVDRLDLSNSLGSWATVKKIERELVPAVDGKKRSTASHDRELADMVPDSWDVADETQTALLALPNRLQIPGRFNNLKHLSLAVNAASSSLPPSWADMMRLSTYLCRLKSLSLAHWPTPTYTPNAAKGRTKVINTGQPTIPTQVYGGTDMYTSFDNNWREAAGILRSLSRNLYCLTWFDLTGCCSWLAALTWRDDMGEYLGADFSGTWRNLESMTVAVGWLPGKPRTADDDISSNSMSTSSISSTRAIEQLYGDHANIRESLDALSTLRINSPRPEVDEDGEPTWNVEREREKQYFKKDVERYKEQQQTAKLVAENIRSLRKGVGARWIDFDFGEQVSAEELMQGL